MEESKLTITMSSTPGLLTLPTERFDSIVAQEPLASQYVVENQPFARGKFAAVKRCRKIETGEEFAAKVIRKRRRGAGLTAESLHEAATLDLCRSCPHIVQLEQVYDTIGETVLILQLAEGGELQSVLDRDEIPEEEDVVRFLRQVLGGLAFLHQYDIAHLDLKPQNLLLTAPFPNCDIKLCDFGIARHIARGADVREILGTPDYVAPEVLNYEPISLATDMWSVGVLAYVLLTGCTPFGGESKQETFCNITRCQLEFPDDLFQDVSSLAMQFISSLLVQDPSIRLTAQQCLDHPWLRMEFNSVDMIPSFLSIREDASTFSSSSTIVPEDYIGEDEDKLDGANLSQEILNETISHPKENSEKSTERETMNTSPVLVECSMVPAVPSITTTPIALKRIETNKTKLAALIEEANVSFPNLPITRRGGSLPFRWKAKVTTGRDPSSDRTSDLGYGSDGISSEISSADSSSDRSSIISLDDSPLEWTQTAMRRHSDSSLAAERLWRRTWERFLPATAGTCVTLPHHLYRDDKEHNSIAQSQHDDYRPWEKICTGSRARAMERFNASSPPINNAISTDASKSNQLSSSTVVRPAPKVSEVRTRLLHGPSIVGKSSSIKAPLLHLDKTEIVKSRLIKFRTANSNQQTES